MKQVELLSAGLVADDEQIEQGDPQGQGNQEKAKEPVESEAGAMKMAVENRLSGDQEQDRGGQENQADRAPGSTGWIRHEVRVRGMGRGPKQKSENGCRGGAIW